MTPLFFLIAIFFAVPVIPALIEMRRKEKDARHFPDFTLYDDLKPLRISELYGSLEEKKTRDRAVASEGLMSITGDLRLEDESGIKKDLVSDGTVVIGELCYVAGSIRGSEVRVLDGTTILGNIVARGNVEIGEGCRIQGVIWAGGNVCLGLGALVQAVSVGGECICYPDAIVTDGIEGNAKYIVNVQTEGGFKPVETTEVLHSKVLVMISRDASIEEIQVRLLVNPSLVRNILKRYVGEEKVVPIQV